MNGFVFDKGIDITPVQSLMGFTYGAGVFGPEVEIRRLEDIRASLRDPQCKGPEQVYSIAMDVGKEEHRALLNKLHLLFGVVTYSAGKLGQEPVRSQGIFTRFLLIAVGLRRKSMRFGRERRLFICRSMRRISRVGVMRCMPFRGMW